MEQRGQRHGSGHSRAPLEWSSQASPWELLRDSGHHRVFINHHKQDGVGQLRGELGAGRNQAWKGAKWGIQDGQWGLGLFGPASQSPLPLAFGYFKN